MIRDGISSSPSMKQMKLVSVILKEKEETVQESLYQKLQRYVTQAKKQKLMKKTKNIEAGKEYSYILRGK